MKNKQKGTNTKNFYVNMAHTLLSIPGRLAFETTRTLILRITLRLGRYPLKPFKTFLPKNVNAFLFTLLRLASASSLTSPSLSLYLLEFACEKVGLAGALPVLSRTTASLSVAEALPWLYRRSKLDFSSFPMLLFDLNRTRPL